MKIPAKKQIKTLILKTPKLFKKIPTFTWKLLALFGLFVIGILLGVYFSLTPYIPRPSEYETLQTQNDAYVELVRGYETLTDLYKNQSNNLSLILDIDNYEVNAEKVREALNSLRSTNSQIIFQEGRLMELRKAAGLPEQEISSPQ